MPHVEAVEGKEGDQEGEVDIDVSSLFMTDEEEEDVESDQQELFIEQIQDYRLELKVAQEGNLSQMVDEFYLNALI